MLIAFMDALLRGNFHIECFASNGDGAFDFAPTTRTEERDGFHEWALISIGCAMDRLEGSSRKDDG